MIRHCVGILVVSLFLSCSLGKSINDGRTAYQQKQYAIAVEMLERDAASITDPVAYAEVSYLLGDSYKHMNDSESSLKWFIEAAKNDYGPEAYWEMAYALKKKERYEDAILSYQRLLRYSDRSNEIRLEIEKCRKARTWKSNGTSRDYILEAITVNSPESDYAPFLLNGRFLVFTSDRIDQIEGEKYNWTGNSFSDLFITPIDRFDLQPFDELINTPANEGTACFDKAGTTMFFTRCFSEAGDSYCRILKSELSNGVWSDGVEVFNMKPRVNYSAPVLIENDDVLVFTSDDPTGVGGHDLYYSVLEDDVWSDPELMPPYLNSIGQERFPTWYDGSLYYSSDHFTGLGGLDIFKTTLQEDGSWTNPENLMPPINSSEDDYSYVIVPEANLESDVAFQAFFTSTRGIYGSDDIYSLLELKTGEEIEEPDSALVVEVEEEEEEAKTFTLQVEIREPIYAVPGNPNSYVVGNRKVDGASVRIAGPDDENIYVTGEDGMIQLALDSAISLDILAGKQDYLNKGESFELTEERVEDLEDGYVFNVILEIEKIYEGVEVVLENIYYDYNEFYIREDAKPGLDELTKLMLENPALDIELSSHTDCRGEDDFNLDLSQKRAKAAIDYIIASGNIDPDRLTSTGYGESRLEITCVCESCTEDEHQINRRTTFKILR